MIDKEGKLYLQTIVKYEIDELIIEYDEKVLRAIHQKQYSQCEEILSDFCFELIDLSNEEQVIILRVFFSSIVNEIIKQNIRKKRLHPKELAYAYGIIATIEKWENITEFLLSISKFVDHIKTNLIGKDTLFEGNEYVEKALQLIHENLEGKTLSVNWLAQQLGISTTHLSNLFKIQFDDNVSNYILNRKMDEIMYELSYTNKSMKAISEKYGFCNQSHFIKHFKKYKGVTPLEFAKTVQKVSNYGN